MPIAPDRPTCPECATLLDVITYFGGKSSAPDHRLSWCPNRECKLHGEGIEERGEPSEQAQRNNVNAALSP